VPRSDEKVRAWCAYEVRLATEHHQDRGTLVFASPDPPAAVATPVPAPVDKRGQRGELLSQALREEEFCSDGLLALVNLGPVEGRDLRSQLKATTAGDTAMLCNALEKGADGAVDPLNKMRAYAAATLAFTGHCSESTAQALQSADCLPKLRLRFDSLLQLLHYDPAVLGSVEELQAFQGCYIDDAQAKQLGEGLQHAEQLKCASLYMDKSQCEVLTALANGLRDKKLLQLDIRMRGGRINDSGLADLASALSPLIQDLRLDFSETPVNSSGWKALAEALNSLENLEKFALFASKTKFDDTAIELVAHALCKQSKITTITLKAPNSAVTHGSIVKAVDMLAACKEATTLKLDFKGTSRTDAADELATAALADKPSIRLGDALKKMEALAHLELGLSRMGLSSAAALDLRAGLCGFAKRVKSVQLDLSNNAVADEGAKALLELLNDLRKLCASASINLRGNSGVSSDIAAQFQSQQFADTGTSIAATE